MLLASWVSLLPLREFPSVVGSALCFTTVLWLGSEKETMIAAAQELWEADNSLIIAMLPVPLSAPWVRLSPFCGLALQQLHQTQSNPCRSTLGWGQPLAHTLQLEPNGKHSLILLPRDA